jgi:pimeloyl-ACP methyl ester carboxylesterase
LLRASCIFLPGLVMPAELRYAQLVDALGGGPRLLPRDLAVVGAAEDGRAYSIQAEVDALTAFADEQQLDTFHLYGHSAGGAVCLAYVAAHLQRVLSLALDEPASDFSADDLARPEWSAMQRIRELPFADGMVMFRQLQVGPSVSAALPPSPPAWMSRGPERIALFSQAVPGHRVAPDSFAAFRGPVYYSLGGLTHPRFDATRGRLEHTFADFQVERFDGLHHLHSAHQAMPTHVAGVLLDVWRRAEIGPL